MSDLQNFIKEQLKDNSFNVAWEESQGVYDKKRSIAERRARIGRVAAIVGQRNVVKDTDSRVYFGNEHGKIVTTSLGVKPIKTGPKLISRKASTSCTIVQKKQ